MGSLRRKDPNGIFVWVCVSFFPSRPHCFLHLLGPNFLRYPRKIGAASPLRASSTESSARPSRLCCVFLYVCRFVRYRYVVSLIYLYSDTAKRNARPDHPYKYLSRGGPSEYSGDYSLFHWHGWRILCKWLILMLYVLLMVISSKFAACLSVTVKQPARHLTRLVTLRFGIFPPSFATLVFGLLTAACSTSLLSVDFGVPPPFL